MPSNCALPQDSVGPFGSLSLDSLMSKRKVQDMTWKGFRFLGRDIHKYIWIRPLCWQNRHAINMFINDSLPIALIYSLLIAILLLILHLSIFFLSSGINWKFSTKLTLVPAVKEEKNNNTNNSVCTNAQYWKDYAISTPNFSYNFLNSGCRRNIPADSKNINIIGRCGGSSSDTIITMSCIWDIVADDSIIISGSLGGGRSRW